MREENEGFSKLICLLNSIQPKSSADNILKQIQSLIGLFELDPNRVIDIILDAFENNLSNQSLISILSSFSSNTIAQLIGFKFQFFVVLL